MNFEPNLIRFSGVGFALVALVFILLSCASKPADVRLMTSSLDKNGGKFHRAILRETTMRSARTRIDALMGQGGASRTNRRCGKRRCLIRYQREIKNPASPQGSPTYTSVYIFDIRRRSKKRVSIRAIGLPGVGTILSCPDRVVKSKLSRCTASELPGGMNDDVVGDVYNRYRLDVSGAWEHIFLNDVFFALQTEQPLEISDIGIGP